MHIVPNMAILIISLLGSRERAIQPNYPPTHHHRHHHHHHQHHHQPIHDHRYACHLDPNHCRFWSLSASTPFPGVVWFDIAMNEILYCSSDSCSDHHLCVIMSLCYPSQPTKPPAAAPSQTCLLLIMSALAQWRESFARAVDALACILCTRC